MFFSYKNHYSSPHNNHYHGNHHWLCHMHLGKVKIHIFTLVIMFPLYPLSIWLHRTHRSDKFVEVINLWACKAIWAHFAFVAICPSRLRLTGSLDISDIQIITTYRCSRYLQVACSAATSKDNNNHVIRLPLNGQTSIWAYNDLKHIDPRELHKIYIPSIILDHVMIIQQNTE